MIPIREWSPDVKGLIGVIAFAITLGGMVGLAGYLVNERNRANAIRTPCCQCQPPCPCRPCECCACESNKIEPLPRD